MHWTKLIETFDDHIKIIAEEYEGYDVDDIEYIKHLCETIVALGEAKEFMHAHKGKSGMMDNPRRKRGISVA